MDEKWFLCVVLKVHENVREWLSGGVSPCQGEGRGFESRLALVKPLKNQGFSFFCCWSVPETSYENENWQQPFWLQQKQSFRWTQMCIPPWFIQWLLLFYSFHGTRSVREKTRQIDENVIWQKNIANLSNRPCKKSTFGLYYKCNMEMCTSAWEIFLECYPPIQT